MRGTKPRTKNVAPCRDANSSCSLFNHGISIRKGSVHFYLKKRTLILTEMRAGYSVYVAFLFYHTQTKKAIHKKETLKILNYSLLISISRNNKVPILIHVIYLDRLRDGIRKQHPLLQKEMASIERWMPHKYTPVGVFDCLCEFWRRYLIS